MGSPTADLFCCRSPWTGTAWPPAPVQQTGGGEGDRVRERGRGKKSRVKDPPPSSSPATILLLCPVCPAGLSPPELCGDALMGGGLGGGSGSPSPSLCSLLGQAHGTFQSRHLHPGFIPAHPAAGEVVLGLTCPKINSHEVPERG